MFLFVPSGSDGCTRVSAVRSLCVHAHLCIVYTIQDPTILLFCGTDSAPNRLKMRWHHARWGEYGPLQIRKALAEAAGYAEALRSFGYIEDGFQMRERTRDNRKRILGRLTAVLAAGVMMAGAVAGCSPAPAPEPAEVSQEPTAVSEAPSPSSEVTVEPTPEPTTRAQVMLPDMAQLYAQNPDIVGWISIDGTQIDYPVMHTPEDGQFYLYRTFEKEEDPTQEGCIFVDESCTVDPRSTNLLIHGHNMKNGTMFHTLLDYKEESFYKEHPIIRYKTLYEEEEYEIAYVFLSKVYNVDDNVWKFYKFYNANNEQEYNDFVSHCKELELYDTGVTAKYDDPLLTLTTCEYSTENGRMVIVARKVTDEFPFQGPAAIAKASADRQVVEGELDGTASSSEESGSEESSSEGEDEDTSAEGEAE